EITGVLPQSCGLVLAVVGLAASPRGASGEREAEALRTGASLAARLTGVLACLAGAFVLIGTAGATLGGELRMKRAYGTLGPVRQLRQSLEAAVRDRSPDAPELAARLRGVEPDTLRAAAETLPTSWPAARSASQLAMQLAQAYAADARSTLALAWGARAVEYALSMPDEALGALLVNRGVTEQEAADAFARVRSVSAAFAAGGRLDSQRAGWAATLCLAAADKVQAPSSREWLEAAVEFLTAAESLDPYNPFHVQRRMDALTALGRRDDARSAARRLLEVDELQRLDRAVRGLSDRDRAKARRIAEAGRG
ncbi:MAG: hypothetical protein K2Q09_02315, partial [Phycisphaerales bacterium]|nr:hypothetical protein [Phycisphaerales bacterium]